MRRVLPIAIVLAAAACSPAPAVPDDTGDSGWGPSVSEPHAPSHRPPAPRALPIPLEQRKAWTRSGEVRKLTVLPARGQSEHLDGRFDRTVAVNAAAAGYRTLTPTTVFAPGALVVQRHHPRGSPGTLVYFVAEKQAVGARPNAFDWRFLVLDQQLRVAAEDNLQLCARCHADAPFEGLFGFEVEPIDEP